MSQPLSRERREAVLSHAEEVGVETAAVEAGVQPRTVERWQAKARAAEADQVEQVNGELVVPAVAVVPSDPVGEVDGGDLEAQLRRTAVAARRAAEKAIARLDQALPQSKNVQSIAVAVGVLSDKAQMLERLLDEADDRKVRLADEHGEVIVEVMRLAFQALGVPIDATRAVVRELLEQAGHGGPLSVSPATAEDAFGAVRGHFERIVRRELEDERRMLAAGPDEHEDALLEGGVDGVVVDEPDGESLPEGEPVEAEVVDGRCSIEEQAREATARIMEKMQAEETEAEGFGVGSLESRAGGFDMRIPGGF